MEFLFLVGNKISFIFCKVFITILWLSLASLIFGMFKYKISIGPIKKPSGKYRLGILKNGHPIQITFFKKERRQ